MALVKCKECSAEISDTTTTCPKCGFVLKKPAGCFKQGLQALAVGFGLLVVITGILGGGSGGKSNTTKWPDKGQWKSTSNLPAEYTEALVSTHRIGSTRKLVAALTVGNKSTIWHTGNLPLDITSNSITVPVKATLGDPETGTSLNDGLIITITINKDKSGNWEESTVDYSIPNKGKVDVAPVHIKGLRWKTPEF